MSNSFFGEGGPIVLSLYDGFFMGGSRVVHTEIVRNLHFTTSQRHSVLALTNRVTREHTFQPAEETVTYNKLKQAGVPTLVLDREGSSLWSSADRTHVDQLTRGSDIILSLKEQPLSALAMQGTHDKPLLVSLHRSDPEHSGEALADLLALNENKMLTKAICCAEATRDAYHRAGLPLDKFVVVPNGVDLARFKRDQSLRCKARDELRVPLSAPVVIIAARYDAMKNIDLFVEAAKLFLAERSDTHFIMCGTGMTRANEDLSEMLGCHLTHEEVERFHCLGMQADMAPFYNAADIVALTSSFGEAAPLCLLEGMACGAIPVTTDVGDSSLMVRDPRLVAPLDPEGMSQAWLAAYESRTEHRSRIISQRQRLSDQRMFDAYSRLIDECLQSV